MPVHTVTCFLNYHLNGAFLCIICVSLTIELNERALDFDINVSDNLFEQCINFELLVKLKTAIKNYKFLE
jgi:hypothetical protein